MDVFIRRHDLSPAEENCIKERQSRVKQALQRHGIPETHVPRVALLGSGGGERASVALLGVVRELAMGDLLDCFLYMAGVSGSTWCMASLYEDSKWSQRAVKVISRALMNMSEGEGVTFSEAVQWLKKRDEEGDLSLTDFWAVLASKIKGEHLETRLLQGDEGDGTNPYPLYSANEKACYEKEHKNKTVEKRMCFEFSPNEVGFLDPGAFIQTPHLKMDFEGGRVSPKQPFKRQPINLAQLQGICSSFLADLVKVLDYLWHWIHSIRSDEDKHHPVFLLADLVLNHANTERSLSALEKLRNVFEDHGQFSQSLKEVNSETWRDMAREGRTSFCHELVSLVGDLTSDLIQVDGTVDDVWWVIKHITPLLACWTFGTVANFLYHFQDPAIPTEMSAKKQMHLIDGGLYLNSPYPSALRQARKIDLIISFDFGEDPFEALWKARDYAASNHLPFPELGSQPTRPKSFYVFEEEGKPTVIHIPLFNMDNCKDPEEIKRMTDEYKTFQVFRCEEKIDHLAYLAAKNVEMNKDKILQEIKKAAERCRAKC